MRGIALRKYALPVGHLSYSHPHLQEWLVAKAWNCDLVRWYSLDREARLMMIAVHLAGQMMESAESNEVTREAKSKYGRPKN